MRLSGTSSQASSPPLSSKWFTDGPWRRSLGPLARVGDGALVRRARGIGPLARDRRGAQRLGGGVGLHGRALRADHPVGGGRVAGLIGLGALLGCCLGLALGAPHRAWAVEVALLAAGGDRGHEAGGGEGDDKSARHLRISFQRAISARTRWGAVPPKLVRLAADAAGVSTS